MRCVRPTLLLCPHNRLQPSVSDRCDGNIAVAMASSAKAVTSGGFKRRVASLRDIPTCFIMCRKSFLCGRRNTFASFSEDELHFSWQAQHFGDLHRHFAWQAQHFRRVVLRGFCESHMSGLCRSGDIRANSVASVAFVRCICD